MNELVGVTEVGRVEGKKWILTKDVEDGSYLYAGDSAGCSAILVGCVYDGKAVHIMEYEHAAEDCMKLYAVSRWVKDKNADTNT